jgi:hypothetical protein
LTALLHSSIYWSGQFFGWMMGMNHSLNRNPRDGFGEYAAFIVWTLVLMLCIFVLLRVLSGIAFLSWFLRATAGVSALAAPAVCFWFVQYHQPVLFYGTKNLGWLWVEEFAAVVCGLLYAYGRWRVSRPTTILLLTFHCAIWCRAYYLTLAFRGPHLLAVPIAAYLSVLYWGYYLGSERSNEERVPFNVSLCD